MRDQRRKYPGKTEREHQLVRLSNPGRPGPTESWSPTRAFQAAFRNNQSISVAPPRKGSLWVRVVVFLACCPCEPYPRADLRRGCPQTMSGPHHRSRQTSRDRGRPKRLTKECLRDRWLENRLSRLSVRRLHLAAVERSI